jgi:hypothetical protein
MIVDRLAAIKIKFEGKAEDKLSEAIKRHIEVHSDVTFIDVIKFLYQSVLGSFHLLDHMTESEIEGWTKRNLEVTQSKEEPRVEKLYGNEWVRINLGAFKQKNGNDYNLLARLFVQGKRERRASSTEFSIELDSLLKLVETGKIRPLDSNLRLLDLVAGFLTDYRERGFPPIHHSQSYSEKNPRYVVVSLHSLLRHSSLRPRSQFN